jgi:hypothetical protein
MFAEKPMAHRSNTSSRSKRSTFEAVEIFKPMSVDELWKVHQTLEKILSRKIKAETAELKTLLAKLKT